LGFNPVGGKWREKSLPAEEHSVQDRSPGALRQLAESDQTSSRQAGRKPGESGLKDDEILHGRKSHERQYGLKKKWPES